MDYSLFGMRRELNGEDGTVDVFHLYENYVGVRDLFARMGNRGFPVSMRVDNDQINLYPDHFYPSRLFINLTEDFIDDSPHYFPLYLDGIQAGTGFIVDDSVQRHYDINFLQNKIENMVITPPAFEDALYHFTEEIPRQTVHYRRDTDCYVFLHYSETNNLYNAVTHHLVRIEKDGSVTEYLRDLRSQIFWTPEMINEYRVDDSIIIENDKVSFRLYDYYVIDIQSGEMTMVSHETVRAVIIFSDENGLRSAEMSENDMRLVLSLLFSLPITHEEITTRRPESFSQYINFYNTYGTKWTVWFCGANPMFLFGSYGDELFLWRYYEQGSSSRHMIGLSVIFRYRELADLPGEPFNNPPEFPMLAIQDKLVPYEENVIPHVKITTIPEGFADYIIFIPDIFQVVMSHL